MHRFLFVAAMLFSLNVYSAASVQEAEPEKETVKKAVETYLYAENAEEINRVVYSAARIFGVEGRDERIRDNLLSKPAKKRPGRRGVTPTQKILAIDIAGNGASVKVATEFKNDPSPAAGQQRHVQYLSLLKLNGDWKIVSILMPSVGVPDATRQ